ncbi:MAG: tetratricopeptide repeat protein [Candidatus Thiodiazotropha endolucinida]|uniref:Tetratricopeptide repeat protein n=1 Tax=Candidatus Thiodiazotropha taylori TaxID=2792791 RepID=A0A9E4NP39_9GAMM|nr:tetratricopeptide repeat protein [Candidatus Thiodiazotropha sp. (ex Lucina pensylvanica)]MBT3040522.1 tetratricopeptide repeat protein [Candidatus Thiodiazotropha sp. (ex Codakia orbicularis)]MBT3052191.1 tetratricopeptide repeat protein [Candidatus Thiodiazotropha sp. (ex Codakia orbicularis)]MCG7980745.1 tetratricopeptide repeat protein [Candidatus Thiodiazotropha taylori]
MLNKAVIQILCALVVITLAACNGTAPKQKAFTNLEIADSAYEQGRWVEAEQHYHAITEIAPNDFYAWFRLGNSRLHQANIEAAIHAYESSLQRDPRQPKPYHNLAEAYLMKAHQSLQRAQNLAEESSYERLAIETKLKKLREIIYKPISDIPSPAKGLIRY